jgi:hypothetical protein
VLLWYDLKSTATLLRHWVDVDASRNATNDGCEFIVWSWRSDDKAFFGECASHIVQLFTEDWSGVYILSLSMVFDDLCRGMKYSWCPGSHD